MALLSLEGSRFSARGCLVITKILFFLKILFWDRVTMLCFLVGIYEGQERHGGIEDLV